MASVTDGASGGCYSPGKPELINRENVVVMRDVRKQYEIDGREGAVVALNSVSMTDDTPVGAIKR